ncbi:DUF6126 family protein [Streptomyces pactum]|uniref:DUF6126 family protein n=1 Tax=Streptomyces pactum TaxID=68249 RepID=UPI00370222A1
MTEARHTAHPGTHTDPAAPDPAAETERPARTETAAGAETSTETAAATSAPAERAPATAPDRTVNEEDRTPRAIAFRIFVYLVGVHVIAAFLFLLFYLGGA